MGKRQAIPTFDDFYRDVKPEYTERLLNFRAAHPYKQVTLNGVRWDYIAAGQGDEVLLLLGGGLSVGEASFANILRYAKTYRVLSPSYPAVHTMGDLVDGLVKLLNTEGLTQAHVFGHSMGAAVAHTLARRYPESVNKLILSSFGLYTPRNARRARLGFAMFKWMPDGYIRAVYMPKIRQMLAGVNPDEGAFLAAYFEELFALYHTKASLVGQFNLLADMMIHADNYRVFEPVTRPDKVLFIAAEDDRGFTHEERAALIATYPGTQTHIFESGGHWVGVVQREAYHTVLNAFLHKSVEEF
ncbi:MAG: alpha/beta hydrolase [Anaerolineae bacterium]|nr:alpha/beta hydrolase [Anaerolineae bacterium]